MEYQETQSFVRRFFASRMFLIILLLTAVIIALNFARAYYQDIQIRREISSLENEVKSLQQKKLESIDLLNYVSSDAFVEEKARTELNLRKPGENVVIVDTSVQNIERPTKGAINEEEYLGNPAKWWYYFVHHSLTK